MPSPDSLSGGEVISDISNGKLVIRTIEGRGGDDLLPR